MKSNYTIDYSISDIRYTIQVLGTVINDMHDQLYILVSDYNDHSENEIDFRTIINLINKNDESYIDFMLLLYKNKEYQIYDQISDIACLTKLYKTLKSIVANEENILINATKYSILK